MMRTIEPEPPGFGGPWTGRYGNAAPSCRHTDVDGVVTERRNVEIFKATLLRELRSLVDRKRHHCYATELYGRKVKTVAELVCT